MKFPWLMSGLTVCLVLGGCSLATPYQRYTGSMGSFGGYYDKQVAEDKFEVVFYGNQFTSVTTGREYLAQRCLELCKEKNYRDFLVISDNAPLPFFQYPNFFVLTGVIQCIK